jgi:hypothetical protein
VVTVHHSLRAPAQPAGIEILGDPSLATRWTELVPAM